MQNKILFLFFISTLCFNFAIAQNFGSAVVLNSTDISAEYGDKYAEALQKAMLKSGGSDVTYYTWNKKSDSPQMYKPFQNENKKEQPITTVAYLEANLNNFNKFSLSSEVDTTGKVTGYFLNLSQSMHPKFKVVHLPTTEVIISKEVSTHKLKKGGKIKIKDYEKYSKIRPEKLSRTKKEYQEILDKIEKDYQREITKHYDETIKQVISNYNEAIMALRSKNDTKLWSIVDAQSQEKKLQNFWMEATEEDDIQKGENVNVYSKKKYGDITVYEQLTLAGVTVEEVTASKTKVKTNIFNRKKITAAIENSYDIVLARNPRLVNSTNVNSDEYKRVQVKSECFTCALRLESMLGTIPNVKLIERQFSPVRDFFVNQYTDEKFIDFKMEKIQGKAEGANYIFELDSKGLKATNVATGRIETVAKKEKEGLLTSLILGNLRIADVINVSLDILDLRIDLLEMEAKKGKAKKVLLYSPVGFGGRWQIKVVKEIDEEVGGRTIVRQEEIGSINARQEKVFTVKEYKVKKGEKEIFEAKESGDRIKFIIQ